MMDIGSKEGCSSNKRTVPEPERSTKCSRSSTVSTKDASATKKRKLDTDANQQYSGRRSNTGTSSSGNEDCANFKFPTTRSRKNNWSEKRVMKATILAWLIDTGVIQENTEVYATDETGNHAKIRGAVKREGILCFCCDEVFAIAEFLSHRGRDDCTKPYENVFIARMKVPLLSYMADAWNGPRESKSHGFNFVETRGSDSYDDACMVCADGGNLMCCEECSSTYHPACMGMQDAPEDSWYCPYCVCKFCAQPACEKDCFVICPQCDKRYHWRCQSLDLNRIPTDPFCEQSCKEVFDKLKETMVGTQNELGEGYSWTLLHRMDEESDASIRDNHSRIVCHSKLVVARRLMEECFHPITDRHTRVRVIPSVVYNCGANFRRVSFEGFYTAVLEKDDEIVTVASLRIHGTKLAEMPFIATNEAYRCRGMCRKLMVAIESGLSYLKVENLIIPSVSEKSESWISGYGFGHLDTAMEHEIMVHNTLMFHDAIRLQKRILP